MDAIRCLDCGDVRWSLMGLKSRPSACGMCGGEMVPERRRPAGMHRDHDERRDLMAISGPGPAADARRPTV